MTEHTLTLELLDWAFVFWGMSNIYVISIRRNPVVCGSVFTLENYYYYSLKKLFICPILRLLWDKAMAPHSSTLAWKISWTEEPGGLQSMGSLRAGHD